jgi:pantothenate synthetase
MLQENEIKDISNYIIGSINKVHGFKAEYFEIVDEKELVPLRSKKEIRKGTKYFGCTAVRAGKIRLIDNIEFPLV